MPWIDDILYNMKLADTSCYDKRVKIPKPSGGYYGYIEFPSIEEAEHFAWCVRHGAKQAISKIKRAERMKGIEKTKTNH